jgi:hypothetical protein
MNSYKKGDWIVLGKGGSGWMDSNNGTVCRIADIGPHLHLLYGNYDFYVEETSEFHSDQLHDPHGGGDSAKIARLATLEEIRQVKPKITVDPNFTLDNFFKL